MRGIKTYLVLLFSIFYLGFFLSCGDKGNPDTTAPTDDGTTFADVLVDRTTVEGTYTVSGILRISAVWTIEAGTVIKLENGASISVESSGMIIAAGTADKPITFTSSKATPVKGDWLGIDDAGNGSVYDYCVVEYAETGLEITGSIPTVTNSRFRHNKYGLNLEGVGGMKAFSTNSFAFNDDPLGMNHTFDIDDSNSFADNARSFILYSDDAIAAARSWTVTKAPIRIVSVRLDSTLTLGPGVTLAFDEGGFLEVETGGKLTAVGTESARIGFTSSRPTKAQDDWIGVTINGNGSRLDYCDVEYASIGLRLESTCGSLSLTNCRIRNNAIGVDDWSDSVTVDASGSNAFSDNGTDVETH